MDKLHAVLGAVLATLAFANLAMEHYLAAFLIGLSAIGVFYSGSKGEKSKSR